MPKYIVMINTAEDETIASLADAVDDSVHDFHPEDATNPGYLPLDEPREATDSDGFHVTFQRTE